MGSAQQFEAVAQRAAALAGEVQSVASHLSRLGQAAIGVIGGTVTGDDQKMLGLAHQAMTRAQQAATRLSQAASQARTAAEYERECARRDSERRQ